MDCRFSRPNLSREDDMNTECSDGVQSIQMQRLSHTFDFQQETQDRRALFNSESRSDGVDLGAAGDATSAGHRPSDMDACSYLAYSSPDDECKAIPPHYRPKKWIRHGTRSRRQLPPREVEKPNPASPDDPIQDTPGIWSSKDRSRLYMYQRNELPQSADDAEPSTTDGESLMRGRQSTGGLEYFQGCATLSDHAGLGESFQRSTPPLLQNVATTSSLGNVSASFQKRPTSLFQSSTSCAQISSMASLEGSSTSSFQRSVAASFQGRVVSSAAGSSAASSFQGSLTASFHESSVSSLQGSSSTSLRGSALSFEGNPTPSLTSTPISFYSNMLSQSTAASPQATQMFDGLMTVPLYGRHGQSMEGSSVFEEPFSHAGMQVSNNREMIHQQLPQQVQALPTVREPPNKGCKSFQKIPLQDVFTGMSTFEELQAMQPLENQSFFQNNSIGVFPVTQSLGKRHSVHDAATSLQGNTMQSSNVSSYYGISLPEKQPFVGQPSLNRNVIQQVNGSPTFKDNSSKQERSSDEVAASAEATLKKKTWYEKPCATVSSTKIRKETLPVSQENGFLYTPHDFPELPTRSIHGSHSHIAQPKHQGISDKASRQGTNLIAACRETQAVANSDITYASDPVTQDRYGLLDTARIYNIDQSRMLFELGEQFECNRNYGVDARSAGNEYHRFGGVGSRHGPRMWDHRVVGIENTHYLFGAQVRNTRPTNVFPMMTDEIFFYLFYHHGKDLSQLEAAERLYLGGWRYHKGLKLWMKKHLPPTPSCTTLLSGTRLHLYVDNPYYDVFDPIRWTTFTATKLLNETEFEERPFVPNRTMM